MYKSSIALGLLALFNLVQAQSGNSTCSNTSGFTISSQSDLDALSSCSTVTGNIIIQSASFNPIVIPSGVEKINGDLSISLSTNVVTVTAGGLESISGTFELLNLTALTTITMGSLTTVGSINFVILPLFNTMTIGISTATNIQISDTQLSALTGISLNTVGDFDINNNRYLKTIEQPTLVEVSGALDIAANSDQLTVSFPLLQTVNNASFRNIESISINSLDNVTSNLGFFTTSLTSISAPNLTSIGSSLSFVNCSSLTNLSFPQLTSIGGTFLIANNTVLDTIGGFSKVSNIGGSIDWTGSFNNASLPALSDVQGGVNVQSSSDTFQCPFPDIQNNGVVKGKGFVCTGKVTNPSSGVNGTNETANSGSTGSSGSSGTKSAADRLTGGMGFAVLGGLVTLALQYLL